MNKIKGFTKMAKRVIKEKKVLVETFILTAALLLTQVTPAFADISGNTIKNNLVNNYFQPIYIVIMVFLLMKELFKRSIGSLIIIALIGGIIGIFVFSPETITVIINTVKGVVGM